MIYIYFPYRKHIGIYMNYMEWKKIAKDRVCKLEHWWWSIQSRLFTSLNIIHKSMTPSNISSWWLFVQHNPTFMWKCVNIMKLSLGVHMLNSVLFKHRGNVIHSPVCQLCDSYENETVSHLLFQCSVFHVTRVTLWASVKSSCPSLKLHEFLMSKSDTETTKLLLTGLNNWYVKEWSEFFKAITNISNMYQQRLNISW